MDNKTEDLPSPEPAFVTTLFDRVRTIDFRPRRNPVLHWVAFALALTSLVMLVSWMLQPEEVVPAGWLWTDAIIGFLSALEFFTRSGFHWSHIKYIRSRFFDFIAIAPGLVLIYYSVPYEPVWIWIILAARIVRVVDRLLGDGFVQRNVTALIGAVEEELTDRVLLRMMDRIQIDMEKGEFGGILSQSLSRNKHRVLQRIRSEHPQGIAADLARIAGLGSALERLEERIYDSIIDVLASNEIEDAIREWITTTFSSMKKEIAVKSWRQEIGIKLEPDGRSNITVEETEKTAEPDQD